MAASLRSRLRRMVKRPPRNITIQQKVRKGLFKIKCTRDKRNKLCRSVEAGWTNNLNALIWTEKRLPCAWSFKSAKVRIMMEDICITGHCKDCSATLTGFYSLPRGTIKLTIAGYNPETLHGSKRRMTHEVKSKISDMLDGGSAFRVRSKLADRLMEAGDHIPAHLPNLAALHKLKSRQMPTAHSDPIQALKLMKAGPYRDDIHQIGLDPFFVFFHTKLQSQWYKAEFIREPAIMAIDSTGPGLRKLDSSEEKPSMLFEMTAKGNVQCTLG